MSPRDEYYHAAKQAGYRSRAAFKLRQLDEEIGLFDSGDVVVDLGAAPGGWLQIAAEAVGATGRVIGVDLASIDPIDADAPVETIGGDITEERTRDRLRDLVGPDGADVVLSDMAPEMTGEYSLDHARSIHLARQALAAATELLGPGGDAVIKVFQGRELDEFRGAFEDEFEYVRTMSPPASRDASSEVYLVGQGRMAAPIEPGDALEVEIVAEGREGDGIARIDGYAVFVPGAAVGDTVHIRIAETKATFGFADLVE